MPDTNELIVITETLDDSIAEFYEKDMTLLTDGNRHRKGMERSCAFRIGHYICNRIKNTIFNSYDVDMEYNKDAHRPKGTENGKNPKYPDLFIHERWNNEHNLLVVEFKHGLRTTATRDIEKLKYYTSYDNDYKYSLGVLVELGESFNDVRLRFFKNGNECCDVRNDE